MKTRDKSHIVGEHRSKNKIDLEVKCPVCGIISYVNGIQLDNYHEWLTGGRIATVFPRLSIDDRERIVTGKCARCQDGY